MTKRAHLRLTQLIALTLLSALLAGCGVEDLLATDDSPGGSGGEANRGLGQAFSTGPQWSDYIPAQSERVCTYSASYTNEDLGLGNMDLGMEGVEILEYTDTQTLEYTGFREEPDGTHFTLRSTTESTATQSEGGDPYRAPLSMPDIKSLEYVLADDGTLRSEPEMFNREGLETGFEMSVDEFMVYPDIGALRQGESHSASITATSRATDPEAQAELQEDLEPGESAMEMRLDYTVEGVPPKEITTPAGTFTDVVGISLKFDDIEYLNANAEARREMDGISGLFAALAGTTTVWYARDVGIVQTETEGGLGEAMMDDTASSQYETTSEKGEAGSGTPPLKLEGCDEEIPESRFLQAWVGQIIDTNYTDEDDLPRTVSNIEAETVPYSEMTGEKVGEVVGDVRYTTVDCSGVWVLEGVNEDEIRLEQRLEEDTGDCSGSVEVALTSPEEGVIPLEYYSGDYKLGTGFLTLEEGVYDSFCEAGEVQDPDCLEQASGFEQFAGEWYVHGTQMIIRPDSTGVQTSNAGPCTDPFESGGSDAMCNTVTQLEFSEVSSRAITATITAIDHETWEGDSPPSGFEPDETVRVGDSFRLEFADDNFLRTTWLGRLNHLNGQFNPYWCNSQTSDENTRECGA